VFESIFKHFYLFASNMLIAFEFEKFIPKPNKAITSLLKNCLPASLFKKSLSENDELTFGLITLSPNPIGVINRRNG